MAMMMVYLSCSNKNEISRSPRRTVRNYVWLMAILAIIF